jgi:hypothetical protein
VQLDAIPGGSDKPFDRYQRFVLLRKLQEWRWRWSVV